MAKNIETITLNEAREIDRIRLGIDSKKKLEEQKEYLESIGVDLKEEVEEGSLTVREGLVFGFLAEAIHRTQKGSFGSSRLSELFTGIEPSSISSTDLIILKAYYYH